MRLKKIKMFSVSLLALFLSITTCITAVADSYTEWITKKGYKITYQYRAAMQITSFGAYSAMYIQSKNGAPIMPGYAGTNAFLFRSTGQLVKSTGMMYLSSASPSAHNFISTTEPGVYYAQGLVSIATDYSSGSYTYSTYNTPQTTRQTYTAASTSNLSTSYKITNNNETYSSGILADILGEYPDLLEAVGTNGNNGYVRYDDLVYTPSSPEEAIIYSESIKNLSIPVYDLEGNIIDSFEFFTEDENNIIFFDTEST